MRIISHGRYLQLFRTTPADSADKPVPFGNVVLTEDIPSNLRASLTAVELHQVERKLRCEREDAAVIATYEAETAIGEALELLRWLPDEAGDKLRAVLQRATKQSAERLL